MRRVLVIYIVYVALQAMTSIDPSIRNSWLVFGVFGLLALTGRWTALVAFEAALWLRIMAVPLMYFYWGSAVDVVAPGLACTAFAYAFWTLRGRRRSSFLVPLAVPVMAIAVIRFEILPRFFPRSLIDIKLAGLVTISPQPLAPGDVRYHCAGYSIGVPLGMTSGYLGGDKADAFTFAALPDGESLQQIAMVFPRKTSFVGDPEVQAMAAQVLGLACEYDYARYVLQTSDGYMFLVEKLGWLGMKPPERIEEIHAGGVKGFLLSVERVNWYRARLYFDRGGDEHQVDIWFYGEEGRPGRQAIPLRKERVLRQLATLRIEPEEREYPTLDDCRNMAAAGARQRENIFLNSLLSLNDSNYEALYLLGMNTQSLGMVNKAFEIRRRLHYHLERGSFTPASMQGWQARYGELGQVPAAKRDL